VAQKQVNAAPGRQRGPRRTSERPAQGVEGGRPDAQLSGQATDLVKAVLVLIQTG
jgi:hypothetical protein